MILKFEIKNDDKENHEIQYAVRIIHCPLSSLLCV